MKSEDIEKLLDRAVDSGVVVKNGNWFVFGEGDAEVKLGNGASNAVEHLKSDAETLKAIAAKLDQGGSASAKPSPAEPPKAGKEKGELRPFLVASNLRHDGDDYEPGEKVKLTRKQYDALIVGGSIVGDWT